MQSDKSLLIAILGCGAVAELGHLPAQARVAGTEVTLLVGPKPCPCGITRQVSLACRTSPTIGRPFSITLMRPSWLYRTTSTRRSAWNF